MKNTMRKISNFLMVVITIATAFFGLFWQMGFFYLGGPLSFASCLTVILLIVLKFIERREDTSGLFEAKYEEIKEEPKKEENYFSRETELDTDKKKEATKEPEKKEVFFSKAPDLDTEKEEQTDEYTEVPTEKRPTDEEFEALIAENMSVRSFYLKNSEEQMEKGNIEVAEEWLDNADQLEKIIENAKAQRILEKSRIKAEREKKLRERLSEAKKR